MVVVAGPLSPLAPSLGRRQGALAAAGHGSSSFCPRSPAVLTSPNYAGSPEEQDRPSPGGETLDGAVLPSP